MSLMKSLARVAAGVMLAKGQLQAELKFEITAPVYGTHRTAIASGNYHEDHFGAEFDLHGADGSMAHSACFGFGLERVALALARGIIVPSGALPKY